MSESAQARYLRYMSLRKMDGSIMIHCPMALITAARMSSDTSLHQISKLYNYFFGLTDQGFQGSIRQRSEVSCTGLPQDP